MPIPDHIRHGSLFGTLVDEEVREILSVCRTLRVQGGELVCRQGATGQSMFLIVRGRVSVDVDNGAAGRELINYLGPGDHFGEMSLLVGAPRAANVRALTSTELLELSQADFDRTLANVPGFAANLSRSLGTWLRGQISGGRRPERMHVALVRSCEVAENLAAQLTRTVTDEGGELLVVSDQPADALGTRRNWIAAQQKPESELLHRLTSVLSGDRRVLLEIDQQHASPQLLHQQELIWWVIDCELSWQHEKLCYLRRLLDAAPQLLGRIQIVRAMEVATDLPPADRIPFSFTHPMMRIQYARRGAQVYFHPRDLARLARRMRGIQMGLALGGGGARGIAHIGVLEVFEREGIFFDRVAGTSAGAIIGAAYAAGIPFPRILEVFAEEMTPPAPLRWLPKAPQWYMLAVFRLGLAEAKFRRYLHDYVFEQLLLPTQTVSVDLISGEHRLRSSGDVVTAVLESINHPVFGRPILRNGEALVDGGVLMNVPVTALRQHNVDFSVAVDIGKQLSPTFAGNNKATPTEQMRRPGYIGTLLRVTDVEQKNLAVLHGSQCDYLIAPDTSKFPFDDFTQGAGLVDAGRRAAEEALPQLKQVLAEHIGWERADSHGSAIRATGLKDAA